MTITINEFNKIKEYELKNLLSLQNELLNSYGIKLPCALEDELFVIELISVNEVEDDGVCIFITYYECERLNSDNEYINAYVSKGEFDRKIFIAQNNWGHKCY